MKIKVICEYAWEVVRSKKRALFTAEMFRKQGYGHSTFQIMDDEGIWVELSEDAVEC
ncbi:hypothetical protein [Aeromonas sanarellii]